MTGFESLDTALRMREVMRSTIAEEIKKYAPLDTVATVYSVDSTKALVWVTYPGETTPVPVSSGNLRPRQIGQMVRITGPSNDRYIAEVLPYDSLGNDIGLGAGSDRVYSRNLIRNGDFRYVPRGVTGLGGITTTGFYTVNDWRFGLNSLGTWTEQRQDNPLPEYGFGHSLRHTVTTADAAPAANDLAYFDQAIAISSLQALKLGANSAQPLTLSFWVKSNLPGAYYAVIWDNNNLVACSLSYTIAAADTWQYVVLTFPPNTGTGFPGAGPGRVLYCRFYFGAGSSYQGAQVTGWRDVLANQTGFLTGQTNLAATVNNYIDLTGVQLEVGTTATPFERLPWEDLVFDANTGRTHHYNGLVWSDVHGLGPTPRVKVMRSATMSAATASNVTIVWDQEEYDSHAMHSTSVSTERLTCVIPGLYACGYQHHVGAGLASSGIIATWIEHNAGAVRKAFTQHSPNTTSGTILAASDVVPMAVGDYLTHVIYHIHGSTINVAGNPTTFWAYRVGPS